ncbi:MAG: dienelactone hydrolase family protein [Verrucomicrobiaceae bacterium]|nr:dienelactone hydrolase family protein [Verrucomicrobiaceae bacterium]
MKTTLLDSCRLLGLAAVLAVASCSTHPCCRTSIDLPCASRFDERHFKGRSGYDYPVYRTKSHRGPPILVLHELNGLSAAPLDFCLELERNGWTAYAPALFGKYGDDDMFAALKGLKKDSRWHLTDPHSSGPVLDDVAAMVAWISRQHGGRRVVVMGNCLSGGFPLALLGRADVRAAILCQPAMPFPTSPANTLLEIQSVDSKRLMALPDEMVEKTFAAMKRDPSKRLIGFHYREDWIAMFEKFEWLHQELVRRGMGEKFKPVVMVPADRPCRQEDWWQVAYTDARRHLKGPHNTVTASDNATDRRHMRDILIRWLEGLRACPTNSCSH